MPPSNETYGGRCRAQDRIPATLQSVFLASNRGHEVHLVPPDKAASKEFFKNNVFLGSSKNKTKSVQSVFGDMSEKVTMSSRKNNGRIFQLSNGKTRRALPVSLFSPNPHKAPNTKNNSGTPVPKQITLNEKVSPKNLKPASPKKVAKATFSLQSLQLGDPPKSISISPHDFLVQQLKERGYSTQTYNTLDTAYYLKPTPLQLASYDVYLIGQVRGHQPEGLMEMIRCGLSPNPCNNYGESLVHTVSRFGNHILLNVLLDQGCSVQVADDYGRTPLHDAFWTARPSFETVELLLQQDRHLLFLLDARGNLPLDYVRKDDWETWIQFFQDHLDVYWPLPGNPEPSPLVTNLVVRLPLADPENALPIDIARLVASGRIKPEEAAVLVADTDDESDVLNSDEDDSSSYDDDDSEEDDSFADISFPHGDDDSFAEFKEVMTALHESCTNFRSSTTSSKATCV